jgi:hypothetical protein
VLLADQMRVIASVAQRADDVLTVVVQREAAMGQTHHPIVVAVAAGQQRRPTTRAGGRRAEGVAEHDTLIGEPLDVRRGDGVAVRLHVTPGVVRVEIEDVRRLRKHDES